VYSLGCVLVACLTGHPPFENHREAMVLHAHIEEPPPKVTGKRGDLSPAVDDVIAKAMAKSPDERYASCTEMMAGARVALTVGGPGAGPSAATPAPSSGPAPLCLRVTAGSAAGEEIEILDELVFGRHATGPGRLAQDSELSRRHARVGRATGGGWIIEDLGSTNGTYVNDQRIEGARPLIEGDRIEVGATKLVVAAGAPAPEETPRPQPSQPALMSEATVALSHTSLRLEIDFDGRSARVQLGDEPEMLSLVFEGGRWRQA
jgi:hypothetical protein